MEEVTSLIEQMDRNWDPVSNPPSRNLIKKVLKAIRKEKIRRSDISAVYGYQVIKSTLINSPDYYGDLKLADLCLEKLQGKFPDSSRVKKLVGMRHEAQGAYGKALEIYDDILKENPGNILVMKRKVCVFAAQKSMKLQCEALHAVLMVYQNDSASWLQLAEVHLSLCDFVSAAHCFEELVLLNPTKPLYYSRLAEVLYSLGDVESLIRARKNLSLSLKMRSAKLNPRAVYNMIATCKAILQVGRGNKKVSAHEMEVSAAMLKWATERFRSLDGQIVELIQDKEAGEFLFVESNEEESK